MSLQSLFANTVMFFIVTNPIGNSPTILSIIKDYGFKAQQKILFREGLFALMIALFFQYFGERFLSAIGAQNYSLTICGGFLLFLLSINMVFPKAPSTTTKSKQEPYIVPIATPLMAGPGLMSMIMIQAAKADSNLEISAAIIFAFIGVIVVMILAPYIQKLIKKRGMDALEQVMGMLLCLIGIEMLVNGTKMFIESLKVS